MLEIIHVEKRRAEAAQHNTAAALAQLQTDTPQRILGLLPRSLGESIDPGAAATTLLESALQGLEGYLHKAHRCFIFSLVNR